MIEWIEKLKVGDDVFISNRYSRPDELTKVTKITKAQIQVEYGRGNLSFWKKNGRSVGSSIWDTRYLHEPTKERYERGEVMSLRDRAVMMRDKLPIPQTKDELLKFIEALKPFIKETN